MFTFKKIAKSADSLWVKITLPIVTSVILFLGVVVFVQLPETYNALLNKRKEALRDATDIAWNTLNFYNEKQLNGEISKQEAQEYAIKSISQIRFGASGKDYFWIMDYHPNMIMHPYIPELNGRDMRDHQDAKGKKFFIDMISETKKTGSAYIPYYWQWQDDKNKIYAKISYVKRFKPWKWIIGTGAYINDIDEDAIQQTQKMFLATLGVLSIISILSFLSIKRSVQASAIISKNEATLREIFQQSKELMIILDLNGSILQANKAVLDMSQFSNHQILNCKLEDVFPDIDLESTEAIKKAVNNASTGSSSSFDMKLIAGNKKSTYLKVTITPINDDEGKPIFIFANGINLTDINIAFEQLEELNANLEARVAERTNELELSLENLQNTQDQLVQSEKMAALGGLVAGVAHEINTPLGLGVTNATFLQEQAAKIKTAYEEGKFTKGEFEVFLDNCEEATRSMLVNLRRGADIIRSFKQVAVDQTNESLRTITLSEYLDEVMLSLKPSYKNSGHIVKTECPEDIIITTYPGLLMQIISNLTMNSLIHAFSDIDSGHITIKVSKENEKIKLVYSDDGVGLTQEQQAKIYDPFFTSKQAAGGTGLGMHIVYNIVTQKLCGSIHLESSPGQGVCFTITIPEHNDNAVCNSATA
ncbi:cache domain-containing protein [Maridesulfovibrio salexigens]|uniref:histidine kinase n=1 Tax=Maridesulfovibrio salexigens (strain ATCC 14822 / DSM 2638 / NCIMB 8403 / VKM B-1763) TaxID=526222 RepID=C6BRY0_MARSD|nr:cache domain-containing protein [Maridesulfovibrio salexigens]ACS81363.1 PAS/PAC sensor signal transduction histidine kinase [Maridesulfovibrio salexigens DSM 2638]